MRVLTFPSAQRSDKSFNIGLGLIIFFAAAEILSASFYYVGRVRPAYVTAKSKVVPAALPSAAPSAPPVALAIASPSPALAPSTSAASVADRLLKEANAARDSGDTMNALSRLQE